MSYSATGTSSDIIISYSATGTGCDSSPHQCPVQVGDTNLIDQLATYTIDSHGVAVPVADTLSGAGVISGLLECGRFRFSTLTSAPAIVEPCMLSAASAWASCSNHTKPKKPKFPRRVRRPIFTPATGPMRSKAARRDLRKEREGGMHQSVVALAAAAAAAALTRVCGYPG